LPGWGDGINTDAWMVPETEVEVSKELIPAVSRHISLHLLTFFHRIVMQTSSLSRIRTSHHEMGTLNHGMQYKLALSMKTHAV
jgi:hypothetical protein